MDSRKDTTAQNQPYLVEERGTCGAEVGRAVAPTTVVMAMNRKRAAGLLGSLAAACAGLIISVPDEAAGATTRAVMAAEHARPLLSQARPVFEQRSRGDGGSSGTAVPRGSGGGASGGGGSGGTSSGGATTRSGGDSSGGSTASPRSGGSGGDTSHSRPRDGQPVTGRAVERPGGGGAIVIPPGGGYWGGYYPWGWGGLGFGGYYGFYDPWWYGGYGYPSGGGGYVYGTTGALRLKVKQRQAEVFVDGYFAGSVNDYDGTFQRLHLDPGPHRVEVRLDGYEPLLFEVRILPDKTITYKGDMRKAGGGN